jgi:hypothetical protein
VGKLADTSAFLAADAASSSPPATQDGWARTGTSERWTARLRVLLGSREGSRPRYVPSPETIEDEAANRLYGERTGTVNVSPASCPVDSAVAAEEHP